MNIADTSAAKRTPRYVEILRALRRDIAKGVHPVGRNLPPEAELCRTFAASRFTVREALRRLQEDGLVRRIQGAGSEVVAETPTRPFVQHYRSVDELNSYALVTRIELLNRGEARLDPVLAAQVGGVAGARWAYFRALRFAPDDTAPLSVLESHMPVAMAAHVPEPTAVRGPIYAALADACGRPVREAVQDSQALVMPDAVADALGAARGAVALRILRRYVCDAGTLIATFNWHHGGDRYVHRTSLSLQDRQP